MRVCLCTPPASLFLLHHVLLMTSVGGKAVVKIRGKPSDQDHVHVAVEKKLHLQQGREGGH